MRIRRRRMILILCAAGAALVVGGPQPKAARAQAEARGEVVAPQGLADAPQDIETAFMEEMVFEVLNNVRRDSKLKPLKPHIKAFGMARAYSRRMALEGFFDHKDPKGKTVAHRAKAAKVTYRALGENLFRIFNLPNPAEEAISSWMRSPGHRRNILSRLYSHTGVGVWRVVDEQDQAAYLFTQIFVKPR